MPLLEPRNCPTPITTRAKWLSLCTNEDGGLPHKDVGPPQVPTPHVFCHHCAVVFFCVLDHNRIHLRDELFLSGMPVVTLRHLLLKNLLTIQEQTLEVVDDLAMAILLPSLYECEYTYV